MTKLTGRQIWHRCTHLSEESDTEFQQGYYKSDEVDEKVARMELQIATLLRSEKAYHERVLDLQGKLDAIKRWVGAV